MTRTQTPVALPSMRELSALATNLAAACGLTEAVVQLQRDFRRLLQATDALCLWIDWGRGAVHSVSGAVDDHVRELVTEVASSGKPEVMGNAVLQPIGLRPARAVIAVRRPLGATFDVTELAMLSTLAIGIAPRLDRLIAAR